MNIDYTLHLTVCALLVLLLTLLGAESDLKRAEETKARPLAEGPPASRAFGWSRFAVVTCVTLLVAVLSWGAVGFWSAVRAGQCGESVAALPVSLLWVASLFVLRGYRIPGTVMYVYLGSLAKAASGERTRTTGEWALYGVGLLATVLVTIFVTRIAKQALAKKITP